jgi:hypothetical protein
MMLLSKLLFWAALLLWCVACFVWYWMCIVRRVQPPMVVHATSLGMFLGGLAIMLRSIWKALTQ